MTERTGYSGPPRRPEDVIAAALADAELMRQLARSLDEERLGIPPAPLREIRAKSAQTRRTA